MLWVVRTAGTYYNREEMEKLKKLGFEFNEDVEPPSWHGREWKGGCHEKAGGFEIPPVELNTIEELLEFMNEYGDIIIEDLYKITIYDDYVE